MDEKYQQLIERLIAEGYLISDALIYAFETTPRKEFLPELYKKMAPINAPLPLRNGQTASQPLTIAFMLELLDLKPGDKIMEIGYGSGWQTALIAKALNLENSSSSIYAYEINEEIAKEGQENLANTLNPQQLNQIHLYSHNYNQNFEEHAPFDKIISGAAFLKKPNKLIKSLHPNGIAVYPTSQNDIRRGIKSSPQDYIEECYPGFKFVPLISS
jgi:protein-L-isoaspartate(D-aspartate) O-methyltransferase